MLNFRGLISVLRFASEILPKLPRRDDGPAQLLFKGLAILDSVQTRWFGKETRVTSIFPSCQEMNNATFVRLFFGTELYKQFEVVKWTIGPDAELTVASRGDDQFIFEEYRFFGGSEMAPRFFHSKGVDFAATLQLLWRTYKHGLYVSTTQGQYGATKTNFGHVPALPPGTLTLLGKLRLEKMVGRHKNNIARKKHRCYLALGPPGTGKTSFAQRLSESFGGRLLKLDASSMNLLNIEELSFLLTALCPDFLVVDDFDRAPVDQVASRLLFLLEHLKSAHAATTVILTVNDPTKLDPALLRSGRIDEPIDFTLPTDNERLEIIQQYERDTAVAMHTFEESAGFNHADLIALCEDAQTEPLEEVIRRSKRLRALATAATPAVGTVLGNAVVGGLPAKLISPT